MNHSEEHIKKWLNQELSASELDDFNNDDASKLHRAIVDGAKQFKASTHSQPQAYSDVEELIKQKKVPVILIKKYALRAVSIAAILMISFLIFNTNANEITSTTVSEMANVTLPDNSKVRVNALSSIDYNSKKWNESREVNLKGEAFFKVAKGATFKVVTKSGTVSVLGTQFNIKQRNQFFEVTCYEGVVEVATANFKKVITAGEVVRWSNQQLKEFQTTYESPQWTLGMSTFSEVPLKEVLEELERQYLVEISYKNVAVDRLFTGAFKHDNLDQALMAITQPMNISYKHGDADSVVIYEEKN